MKYSDCFGKKSSRILLGTAYFGDGISEETAFSMMDKFREMGGTHIDTARLYANGIAEEIVGKWVKARNATDMLISTKGGYYDNDKGESPRISEKEIRSDLEKSLRALGLDTIDFYWLHRDDEAIPVEEIVLFMNKLVKEGKIKRFGASNWSAKRIIQANQFAKENGLFGFLASQMRFNPAYCVTERPWLVGMDKESFALYKEMNLPVVAYSSQAKGFFSKMAERGEKALSEKAKNRYLCEENLKRLAVMQELAQKYNCSVASIICGAFSSFTSPEVFPIIGGSSVAQIEDSMRGGEVALSETEGMNVFSFLK